MQRKCLGQNLGKETDFSARKEDAAWDGLGVPALLCRAGAQGLLADSEPASPRPREQGQKSGLSHGQGTGGQMGVGEKS